MKSEDKEKIGRLLRGSQSRSLGEILLKNSDLSEKEKAEILNANPPFGTRKVGPGLRQQLKSGFIATFGGVTKEDLEKAKEDFIKSRLQRKQVITRVGNTTYEITHKPQNKNDDD